MPIIDCHVHTWDWLGFTAGAEGPGYWQRCLQWAERFDATFITSAPKPDGERLISDPPTDYCHRGNQNVFDLVQISRGRAVGLCYVNPKDTRGALAEMEEWIGRRGFVGLKLLVALHCDDPKLDPLVEFCAAHRIPVCQHTWHKATGNSPGESTPDMFAALAKRHPTATMVMYHTGGDFIYGAKAARGRENVYCDLGGADAVEGVVEQLVDHVGAERVVFGSDLPGRSLTSQLAKVLGARLSDDQKEQILYRNMRRILDARQPPAA